MTNTEQPITIMNPENVGIDRYQEEGREYDAILVMSFGGPEGVEQVVPFLENVTRGRGIPKERLEEVGEHYYMFDGVSPINQQNRDLIDALRAELDAHGIDLPIYFGNRNWHPMIGDTMQQMQKDGVKRAVTFFTSGYSCYSGCRQYRENIVETQGNLGEDAPVFDKIRVFYNHPNFIEVNAESLEKALDQFPDEKRQQVQVAFTAHSIPMGMAQNSAYEAQLMETARLVAEMAGVTEWKLVYQSRSGPPQVPWLEPDILDHMDELHQAGKDNLVILPIGFISDHMEVMFDLDVEAKDKAEEHGMQMVRAASAGTHPKFISMIRELIQERMTDAPDRRYLGNRGPNHDVCPVTCCMPSARKRPARPQTGSAESPRDR